MDSEAVDFDPRLKAPFTLILAGPSRAGKTELTKSILLRRDEIIDTPIEKVVYCYGAEQPEMFKFLKDRIPGISFQPGLPEEFGDSMRTPMIYVIDDLMEECSKSKDMLNAFVRGSHHRKISIIFLTQNFFHPGIRPLSINSKYICVFKNPRDTAFVNIIGRQMNAGRKNQYMEHCFDDCIKRSHGYMFLDLSQEMQDDLRIRNNIFPDHDCIVYKRK